MSSASLIADSKGVFLRVMEVADTNTFQKERDKKNIKGRGWEALNPFYSELAPEV